MRSYEFTQQVPEDVDIRVMSTFVEFYQVLLNFVLYRLWVSLFNARNSAYWRHGLTVLCGQWRLCRYTKDGQSYPPNLAPLAEAGIHPTADGKPVSKAKGKSKLKNTNGNANVKLLEDLKRDMDAIVKRDVEAITNDSAGGSVRNDQADNDVAELALWDSLSEIERVRMSRRRLFKGAVVWIGREVPRGTFTFLITACGGEVVPVGGDESDLRITLQVSENDVRTAMARCMYTVDSSHGGFWFV